jgi:predicted O-methyltransferase YrrM
MKDWSANYGSPGRDATLTEAKRLFRERGGRVIVETGAYHGIPSQGCFTFHLAALAAEVRGDCWTIELNPEHAAIAAASIREAGLASHWHIRVEDSVGWLSRYTSADAPIDLLLLDSYDHEPANPMPSRVHQLAELGAAYGKLAPGAIILLDDAGAKSPLAEDFLAGRGWKVLARDEAVLLSR